jgi:hypothetical protein
MNRFNFRKFSAKDLFFVKKHSKTRIFEGNKILKFKPSTILLSSMTAFLMGLAYKYQFIN